MDKGMAMPPAKNPAGSTGLRPAWRRLAVGAAALLLASEPVRADGFAFEGDTPAAPHVLIDLTGAQLRRLAAFTRERPAGPFPEIALTPAQRAALRERTGKEASWVFAARREWLEGDCSCGSYNLGVLAGKRLAVLEMGLGDHISPSGLAAMERALVDPGLLAAPSTAIPSVATEGWVRASEVPSPLRSLAAHFPGEAHDRRLELRGAWRAQRLRLAALPRMSELQPDPAASLHRLRAVWSGADPSAAVQWPALGARLEMDGAVILLVPGIAEGELGPPAPVWFLLEYREGRLIRAAVRSEWGWSGATYEWPEGG